MRTREDRIRQQVITRKEKREGDKRANKQDRSHKTRRRKREQNG